MGPGIGRETAGGTVARRVDYYHDPAAPAATVIVVGASAVAVDGDGRFLLQRREDNGQWALPGGAIDPGESMADCAAREVKEETGFDVVVDRMIGVYSDPGYVHAYHDGQVRQVVNVCCAVTIVGGELAVSEESTAVAFFAFDELDGLDMHPSHRQRIADYLAGGDAVLR